MESWKILLIIGIVLIIIYFYRRNNENFEVDNDKYYDIIHQRAKNLNRYPIDIDVKKYKNNFNVKMNRILTQVLDLANKNVSYPIIFNPSLKPVEKTDETNNPNQVEQIINYLGKMFNSYDSSFQITNMKVNKLYKHLTEQQLKYDLIILTDIKIMDNKKEYTETREIYMEVIISKFISGEIKPSYELYIKALNLANMDHLMYLSGLEKQINLEQIKMKKNDILEHKKKENEKEVEGLSNNFDPKYPEYSIYETFVPANQIDSYAECGSDIVNTDDILDIFQ